MRGFLMQIPLPTFFFFFRELLIPSENKISEMSSIEDLFFFFNLHWQLNRERLDHDLFEAEFE